MTLCNGRRDAYPARKCYDAAMPSKRDKASDAHHAQMRWLGVSFSRKPSLRLKLLLILAPLFLLGLSIVVIWLSLIGV